jgi:NADPH-dependent 2,4-dienoyl-CoA reductase/sulfur reductase-like enzyme
MQTLRNVVVVGASAAGLAAADGLREAGFEGNITILSAETVAPYDRPALSKGLLESDEELPLCALRTDDHLAAQGFDLRLGQGATGLDIDRHYVITTDGEPIPYDGMIVATGARAREVHTRHGQPLPVLRTAADLSALRKAAETWRDIAVIGLGFIGLEIAAALQPRGVQVSIFGRSRLPLHDVLGHEVAAALHRMHADHGVAMHATSQVIEVVGEPGAYRIRTAEGQQYRASHVVAGVGIDPETGWLARSGVAVNDGVVCDLSGCTSVPGIYAAGDAARWPGKGRRGGTGHWMGAINQGRHVAHNLIRAERKPLESVPYFWTTQYGRKYCCYGRMQAGDQTIVVDGTLGGDFLALFTDGVHLNGVVSCGRERLLRVYRKLLQRNGDLPEALELATTSGCPTAVATSH